MSKQEDVREVAKHLAGQSSKVQDGYLNQRPVTKAYGEANYDGDRIQVVGQTIFRNGSYVGSLP